MTAHEQEECFVVELTLRNFPPQPAFVVKWEWPLFRCEDADPAMLKKSKTGRESIFSVSDILEALGTDELKTGVLLKKTRETTLPPMSEATFYALLKKAVAQKKISKSKITGEWSALQ